MPSDTSRVCAKHFHNDDFTVTSTDSKVNRKNSREVQTLQRKCLKPGAIPGIFAALPSYLSSTVAAVRSTNSSSSARTAKENDLIQINNNQFLRQDDIGSLEMLKDKLKNEILPEGFTIVIQEENLQFYYFKCSSNAKEAPEILISVTIAGDLKVHACIHRTQISHETYKDLIPTGVISKMSQLLNLLALCKSMIVDPSNPTVGSGCQQKSNYFLSLAIKMLHRFIDEHLASQNIEASQVQLVQFIIEQLQLMQLNKHGRRYSTGMMKTAFLWQLTSNSLYKKLRMFFLLPSVRRLQSLSAGTSVATGSIDLGYLNERIKDLSVQEKIVTLILDEVYIAERVEYSNGSFIGLTEDGISAKTVLGFMVQSICSKYKDIVCLVPVTNLDTSILRKWFLKVMKALHDLFIVVAVSADNHICNRYDRIYIYISTVTKSKSQFG